MTEKMKKPIYKRWWFILILGIFLISAISGSSGTSEEKTSSNNDGQVESSEYIEKNDIQKEEVKDDTKTIKNGTYLVGKDIEAGLYKVKVTDKMMKMGYIERAKDVSMDLDDIIANIIMTGDGYLEIKDTDVAVKLQGVEIYPINYDEIQMDYKEEVSDGIYLVGKDLERGDY